VPAPAQSDAALATSGRDVETAGATVVGTVAVLASLTALHAVIVQVATTNTMSVAALIE